jgi:hypothetical protein
MTTKLQPVDSSSVFDTSLRFSSYAGSLRSSLFKKAITIVDKWDMGRPSWELSRAAKKLANEMFNEYSENLQAAFNQPDYSFWLSNSISAQKRVFIPNLLEQIQAKITNNE